MKPRYNVSHVERLYHLIKQYLSYEFNLICLTDENHHSDLPINFIDVDSYELDTWWNKVLVFNYSEEGMYFDLDVDIKGSIDFLFDELEERMICTIDTPWKDARFFSQPGHNNEVFLHYGNTSVMGWLGDHRHLITRLLDDVFKHTIRFYGDDGFIHEYGSIKHFSRKIDSYQASNFKSEDCRISIHHVVTSP